MLPLVAHRGEAVGLAPSMYHVAYCYKYTDQMSLGNFTQVSVAVGMVYNRKCCRWLVSGSGHWPCRTTADEKRPGNKP
jgi:hypothetical protein